jgi:hypothetical protein
LTEDEMDKPPKIIYLQWAPDIEVTWCVDRINESDEEYILVEQPRCGECNYRLDKRGVCPECADVYEG